jgi:hypothetical protein
MTKDVGVISELVEVLWYWDENFVAKVTRRALLHLMPTSCPATIYVAASGAKTKFMHG